MRRRRTDRRPHTLAHADTDTRARLGRGRRPQRADRDHVPFRGAGSRLDDRGLWPGREWLQRTLLESDATWKVLSATAFLHATNKVACERGTTSPFQLQPGVPTELVIVYDQPDSACGVPATISDMKLVVEGPVQTASLQEWAIRYELRP